MGTVKFDFGRIFDKYDTKTKVGELDANEAAELKKAGYNAEAGMNKSIFVKANENNSASKDAYNRELLMEINEKLDDNSVLSKIEKSKPEEQEKMKTIIEKTDSILRNEEN